MKFLDNLSISIKMLIIGVIASVAIIAVALFSAVFESEIRIGSESYDDIITTHQLHGDSSISPLSLMEPYIKALEYATADSGDKRLEIDTQMSILQRTLGDTYRYWEDKLPNVPELRQALYEVAFKNATDFFAEYKDGLKPAVRLSEPRDITNSQNELKDYYLRNQEALKVVEKYSKLWQEAIVKEADQKAETTTNSIIIMVVTSLFLFVVLCFLIAKTMISHIKYVGKVNNTLATGDLTVKIKKKSVSNDEIGQLAKTTRKIRDYLLNVIGNVTDTSKVLAEASEGLYEVSEQMSITTEGIEKAVNDIAAGAMAQAESTETASKQIAIMGENMEAATYAIEQLNMNSGKISESSKEALTAMEKLSEVTVKTREAVEVIYRQTNETNEFAQKIGDATTVIDEIATETNLLSLNASIEAARAGEAGRGFAVVAEQIKKLAEQSSQSAQEIASIVNTLNANSDKAVETMKDVKKAMKVQGESLEKTKESFNQVNVSVERSVASINAISDTIEQLNDVRAMVIDAITNLSAISEENAASAQETSASTQELTATAVNVAESVEVLRNLAEDLKNQISQFKVKDQEANEEYVYSEVKDETLAISNNEDEVNTTIEAESNDYNQEQSEYTNEKDSEYEVVLNEQSENNKDGEAEVDFSIGDGSDLDEFYKEMNETQDEK